MEYEVLDFHFVSALKLAVSALADAEAVVAEVLQRHHSVGQVGNGNGAPRLQAGRAKFSVGAVKTRVALLVDGGQLLPVVIAQVARQHVERALMRLPVVASKSQQALQGGASDVDARPALDVKRKVIAVGGQAQLVTCLLRQPFSDEWRQSHASGFVVYPMTCFMRRRPSMSWERGQAMFRRM